MGEKRRWLPLAAALLVLAGAARGQTVLRLNELGANAGPEAVALETFRQAVETATHDGVRIDVHFDAARDNPSTSIENLMSGDLDMMSGDLRYMLPLMIDEVTGLDLPFMVPDNASARHYLTSRLVAEAREKVLAYRRIRLLEVDAFRGPERMLAAVRPVRSLDDLHGLKLAVFPGPTKAGVQIWAALGVGIVDIDWPDVVAALRQRRIDGVIAPDLTALVATGVNHAAPFIGPVRDHPQVWQIAISDTAWRKLDPGQQDAMNQAAQDAAGAYNRTAAAGFTHDSATAQGGGAQEVSIDSLLARERLRAVYAQLIAAGATSVRVRDTAASAIAEAGETRSPFPVDGGGTFRDCATCPVMVVIPAGQFVMGSPATERGRFENEGPQRTVGVSHPFAIARFPVTMGELRAWQAGRGPDLIDNDPAVMMTWGDAGQYAAWLSDRTGRRYHLPTEAEYEYAERAGTTTAYYWGDTIGRDNANCFGCGSRWDGKGSSPVGSFPPNRFGLHDMTGNVFEWVQDCYFDSEADAPADAFVARESQNGPCTSRTLRGSSWFNLPSFLRSAYRFHELPEAKNSRRSFRLVVD